MGDEPSNWKLATQCPFCEDERQVSRLADEWHCDTCGKSWKALTQQDRRVLRALRILPAEPA